MTTDILPEGFDFTDPDLNWEAIPHEQFARPAARPPRCYWVEQPPESRVGHRPGVRHRLLGGDQARRRRGRLQGQQELVVGRERRDHPLTAAGCTRDDVELQRVILLNQDPPEHTGTRHIISRGFTPRAINALEEVMTERANRIVKEAAARGGGDFVEELAAELPLQAIAELIGVPMEDRKQLFHWSNRCSPARTRTSRVTRRRPRPSCSSTRWAWPTNGASNPQDDIITKLINADKDGRGLNDDEFGYFVMMLAVAGNETTRNAITHGMHAFLTNPDQWKLWVEERPDTMVDEVIRWASPIIVFQRTALNDTRSATSWSRPASGWGCSTAAPTTTRTSSRTPTPSTSCGTPTRTWPSVATARTTASAPTWPARRSG